MASSTAREAPRQRGALIVFEGVDRCGKTTQSTMLVDSLNAQSVPAELWRFPDRTTVLGQLISNYLGSKAELSDAAIHLVFSANRWEKKDQLLAKLNAGTTLVVDRYSFSGVAYTSAKEAPGLGMQWCKAPEVGLPAPDLVVFMELSPEASAKRGGYGEERYEKAEFQRKVLERFKELQTSSWAIIDADQPIEAIHQQVLAAAQEAVSRAHEGAPLTRLWDGEPLALSSGSGGQGGQEAATQQQQQAGRGAAGCMSKTGGAQLQDATAAGDAEARRDQTAS